MNWLINFFWTKSIPLSLGLILIDSDILGKFVYFSNFKVTKAEEHKEEDREWKEKILKRNKLEADAQKTIRIAMSQNIGREALQNVVNACKDILDWLGKHPV